MKVVLDGFAILPEQVVTDKIEIRREIDDSRDSIVLVDTFGRGVSVDGYELWTIVQMLMERDPRFLKKKPEEAMTRAI